jgi:hypothetical protein
VVLKSQKTSSEVMKYLLQRISNIDVSIDHVLESSISYIVLINSFFDAGINIEIIHCSNNRNITNLFEAIDIKYIRLIKNVYDKTFIL